MSTVFKKTSHLALVMICLIITVSVGVDGRWTKLEITKENCVNDNESYKCEPFHFRCKRICTNKDYIDTMHCDRGCHMNCVCNDGFLRDETTMKCVPKDSCPTKHNRSRNRNY